MIILGVDPGSRKAGFGLIEVKGRKINYLESGVMRYDCKKDFMDRLGNIYLSCEELVKIFSPDQIAIESLIYVKSISSLAKLAQARGAMIAAFMKTHKERVFEYSPNLVKSTVTGHGHADKESVNKALKMMFKNQIQTEFGSDDESDALAIAVCHSILKDQPIKKKDRLFSGGSSLKEAFK
jgi:crossover junction endodeoxyribonuclease RuvC